MKYVVIEILDVTENILFVSTDKKKVLDRYSRMALAGMGGAIYITNESPEVGDSLENYAAVRIA